MDTRYTELFSKERKDIEAMTQEQKIEHMEQLKNIALEAKAKLQAHKVPTGPVTRNAVENIYGFLSEFHEQWMSSDKAYSPENIAEELDQFMKSHSDNELIRLEQSCKFFATLLYIHRGRRVL